MSEEDLLGEILGWAGVTISTYFFIAPVVPYYKLIKGKITYHEVPSILLICSLLNCFLWADYGLLKGNSQQYAANGIGGSITLIFTTILLIHIAERKFLKALLYNLFLIACVVEIYFFFYYIVDVEITGIIVIVFNILMYAAPAEKIYTICKTGNYKLIPIFSTIGAFAGSACWLYYGLYKSDMPTIVPNALGLANGIFQVIIYIVYRKKYNKNNPSKVEETAQLKNIE